MVYRPGIPENFVPEKANLPDDFFLIQRMGVLRQNNRF